MSKRRAEAPFDKGRSNRNDSLADLGLLTSENKRQRTKVAANSSPKLNSHDTDWDGCSNESRADPRKGENLNPSDENSGSNTNPDANLMDNDEAHLASLFGKERQQELCQQNERSKAMSKRFEIEFPKQQENSSSISNIDEDDSGTKAEKPHQYESSSPEMLSPIQNIVESPQIYSVLPHEDWPEWPTNFSTPDNETEFVDIVCYDEFASLTCPQTYSVLPHEDELGLLPIDFSALSNETEFAVYASSSTNKNVTGDENVFFESPAPGMHMESIVDVLQLGQGLASTDDSNESLPDLPFELATFNYMEQTNRKSDSTFDSKMVETTRLRDEESKRRQETIDLNRSYYNACMTSIRVLEEMLVINSEKQSVLIGTIAFLKLNGTNVKKGKRTGSNLEIKLPSLDSKKPLTPKTTLGRSRGRPSRGNLSLLDKRLVDLLATHRVIHSGRRQNTFHPGDVRRLAIVTAATISLVPISDLTLPEDISELPEMYRETAKMAVELSKVVTAGSEPEPFPPNIVLLTGLRGLLIESTRVDLSPVDIDMGDPDMDAELFRMFKSFFGGWCQPFIESFNGYGYGHTGKANENSKSGDPEVADYGNTPAASLFLTQAEKKSDVNESGSSVGGAGDEKDDIAGDRPSTGVSQADCKRSTRTRTPVKSMSSSKDGGRNWTDVDKQNLVSELENFGFDSDFSHLASRFKNRSVDSLRYLIDNLMKSREIMEWELNLESKIDQLLHFYPASFLTRNFYLVLKLKSLYGQFPDPAQVGGIKYAECYLFLASLMAGHVPRRISISSKRKLFSVFFFFVRETIAALKQEKCIFEKKDLSHFESRQDLFERRSKKWTIEETAASEIIESGNLEEIKKFYCSHTVLNPLGVLTPAVTTSCRSAFTATASAL